MIRKIAAAFAALALSLPLASAAETADDGLTFGVYMRLATGGGGSSLSLAIGAPDFTSITDLTPLSQFTNGWTAALTIPTLTPAGTTSAYNLGWTPASPASNLTLTVSSPGYTSTGGATSVTRTVYGTSWLRQTYNNATLPTESATGGVRADLTLSDYIYQADTVTGSSVGAGLYTNGSASPSGSPSVSSAASNGYPTYPVPVCVWVTPPMNRYDASASVTIEMHCTGATGNGSGSVAAVAMTMTDGTNAVTHTTSTQALSNIQVKSTCTGTNGSNVLTSCGSTVGWIVGMRASVPGIPGQPKLSAKTATSLTFSTTDSNCTTTTNSGNISFTNNALAPGDVIADGAFVGVTITGSNITGTVSVTSATATADVTLTANKATAAMVHTNAATTVAATNGSCTINHIYQGATGSVVAVAGTPVYDYQVTFTAADLATLTDGAIWTRAKVYPVIGNAAAVLDTQTGADGSGNDWQGVSFATNGQDISPNLHNLAAYKDAAGAYAPVFAFVNPVAGGSPAVQTSSTDPGSAAYYGSIGAAVTALKTYYNANKSHNDANGGVVCLVGASTSYAGFGTAINTSFTTGKPPGTLTSVLSGQTCSAVGAANADTSITLTSVTGGLNTPPPWLRVNNITLANTGAFVVLQGGDGSNNSTFPVSSVVLSGDIEAPTSAEPNLYRIGAWWTYNSLVNESAFDGNFVSAFSVLSNAPTLTFGSTIVCGTFAAKVANFTIYNALGNTTWACQAASPSSFVYSVYVPQPLSIAFSDNKIMGAMSANTFGIGATGIRALRFALTNNVIECVNDTSQYPCLQVSADGSQAPMANTYLFQNTVIGDRTNHRYLEGVPTSPLSCPTTGGTIPASTTNYFEVSYALASNPTVETSTDGVTGPVVTTGTTSSCNFQLVDARNIQSGSPDYVAYISMGQTATPDSTWTYLTVGGSDSKQLAGNQSVVATAVSATLHQPPTLTSSSGTGHNEFKTLNFDFANIFNDQNMKTDTYAGSGATPNGARVGNWAGRWHVGDIGDVWVTGSVISPGAPSPTNGMGEVLCPYCTYGASISYMTFKSDRSWGGPTSSSLVAPALNLGMGDYCPNTTSTVAQNRVPSGRAVLAVDAQGNARKNDGTGSAGAYEGAFCL